MNSNSLPGHPHFSVRDGELHAEGLRVGKLARQYGTPLFVY